MLIASHEGRLWIGHPAPDGDGIALTSRGLQLHRHGMRPELVQWSEVSSVEMLAAVSLWRHPRLVSWVLNLAAAVLSIWSPADPDGVQVVVRRSDATTVTAEATAAYLTGYPRAEVDAVSELLRLAVADPAARPMLDETQVVVEAVSRAVQSTSRLELPGLSSHRD